MKIVYAGLLLACLQLSCGGASNGACAADETSCSDGCTSLTSDRDNCGACGHACGDGLVCSQSQCVEGCDNGEDRCNGVCTDTSTDVGNCGACGSACTSDQICTAGACGCATGDLVCSGVCTNPLNDSNHCGASGDCETTPGVKCGTDEGCLNGTCASTLIYRGSLPASTGVWNYGGTPGIAGADTACAAQWPGTAHCSYTQLQSAAAKNPSELINAADYSGSAVVTTGSASTSQYGDFWIDDPTADGRTRCNFSQTGGPNIPWSYGTSHLGNVGRYVTLTADTGQITAVQTGNIVTTNSGTGLCSESRFVACCTVNPAL
jgi:hypothetical protein